MNYKILIAGTSLLLCFCFADCKKKMVTKTELEKLPPITQTGANTFGCLLNGVAWIPKDNYGQATFRLEADPTFQDGVFGVTASRNYSQGKLQSISVGSDSCRNAGIYSFSFRRNRAYYADYDDSLVLISGDVGTFCTGNLTITRYDLINRIFSGTFEYTIAKAGSDTIRITNGRFDKKF